MKAHILLPAWLPFNTPEQWMGKKEKWNKTEMKRSLKV